MSINIRQFRAGCALLAISLAAPLAFAADLYRYRNDDGVLVVDYQVPANLVKNGYEVLNAKGQVVRVVPRQLTEEEQKAADALKEEEEKALAAERAQREWDETLLLRYSTVEDIEAARERALGNLRIRVSILKSNKRSLKQQVENYQAEAAEMERRGQKVDVQRLEVIKDLQSEIAVTDRAISDRLREIGAVEAAYQKDIDRFVELEEMVELRRSLMAQKQADKDTGREDPRR